MILSASLVSLIDPFKQIKKSQDSKRLEDVTKIRTTADIYYDDKNCYPQSIPFGSQWKDAQTAAVYMNPVPQDPERAQDSTKSYLYETNGSACPQWNVIYGRITYSSNKSTVLCPLEQMSNCLPPGYGQSAYNYCVVSGNVNCNFISSNILTGLPTNIPTPTPTPPPGGGTPNPTPTPTPPAGGGTPTPTPPSSCINGTFRCFGTSSFICLNGNYLLVMNCSANGLTCNQATGICSSCSKDYICSLGRCNVVSTGTGTYCTSNCDNICQ